jgi:Tfp pilus assembly protein PilX
MKLFPAAAPANERGFILVGVVTFMIALTILGLSLFTLSSYEAQFFYASQSREQALQSSESGIEVVKSLLSDPAVPSTYRFRLEAAQLAVGHFGITQALAYQMRSGGDTTSRGPINWDSTLVIVVAARTGGEERTVQSRFVAVSIKDPYQQLISSGGRVWYNPRQDDHATTLRGGVWQHVQSASDSEWTAHVSWPAGGPIDTGMPPALSASSFVDANQSLAHVLESDDYQFSSSPYWMTMDEAPATKPFYRLPPGSLTTNFDDYELYCDSPLEIHIHGTVIWLVSQGVCFRNKVTVTATDPSVPSVLVIVAKPNPNDTADPNRGIWFQGGLVNDSTTTRVFLVSDGDISFTQDHNGSEDVEAQALSIVAGGDVELMGPDHGGTLEIGHAAVMNSLADDLITSGLLPATSGGTGKAFKYAWHSWLETRLP